MKKFTFTLIALATLTLIGCRQQDEIFTNEDNENLELLKRATNTTEVEAAPVIMNAVEDGDPALPPRR